MELFNNCINFYVKIEIHANFSTSQKQQKTKTIFIYFLNGWCVSIKCQFVYIMWRMKLFVCFFFFGFNVTRVCFYYFKMNAIYIDILNIIHFNIVYLFKTISSLLFHSCRDRCFWLNGDFVVVFFCRLPFETIT